jgi:isopenicillin-N epimerase
MITLKIFLPRSRSSLLNHGSGATPLPVFEAIKNGRKLERQPVLFLGRQFDALLNESRTRLGEYLNTSATNLVYLPNATYGVNIIARSLRLQAGDEILSTNHEYGACDYTWEFICQKNGALYIHQPIPLPANSSEEILEQFWQGVTSHTL